MKYSIQIMESYALQATKHMRKASCICTHFCMLSTICTAVVHSSCGLSKCQLSRKLSTENKGSDAVWMLLICMLVDLCISVLTVCVKKIFSNFNLKKKKSEFQSFPRLWVKLFSVGLPMKCCNSCNLSTDFLERQKPCFSAISSRCAQALSAVSEKSQRSEAVLRIFQFLHWKMSTVWAER